MADTSTNGFTAEMEDDLAILPDGWGEGDDFFNVDSWGGESSADESKSDDASGELDDIFSEKTEDSTTTADETASESSSETEEPTTQDGVGKTLKFSATVDHETRNVELDEAELPTIYQKAQATERAQAKLGKMQPVYDKALRTAKILGYDTIEEMLSAAEDSFRDNEVDRLVSEGTQKDVAEDYVRRKMKDAAAETETENTENAKPNANEGTPKQRDFRSEVAALLDIRPDLKKPGTRLPEAVTEECVNSGRPLTVVYLEWEAKQQQAKYDALLKENKKLKQNAEAASRAPVRGVSKGAAVDNKADDDPFLKGFNFDD